MQCLFILQLCFVLIYYHKQDFIQRIGNRLKIMLFSLIYLINLELLTYGSSLLKLRSIHRGYLCQEEGSR